MADPTVSELRREAFAKLSVVDHGMGKAKGLIEQGDFHQAEFLLDRFAEQLEQAKEALLKAIVTREAACK